MMPPGFLGIILSLAFVVGCLGFNEIEDYENLGCYMDDIRWRDLPFVGAYSSINSLEMCADTCRGYKYFGVQELYYCYCGDKFGQYGKSMPQYCQYRCAGNNAQYCGGAIRNQVYEIKYKPGTFRPALRYQEIGCYKDNAQRDLAYYAGSHIFMGPEMCLERCGGYPFFGLQNNLYCFCGDNYGRYGKVDSGQCKTQCPGDRTYNCGGIYLTNVFVNHYYGLSWGYARYAGCFKFGTFPAAATVQQNDMTVQKCHDACKGYTHFALKNGNTCHCANGIGDGYLDAPGFCDSRCAGDEKQICGGGEAYSVFVLIEGSDEWPECTSDQMVQKDNVKSCMNACALSTTCKMVAYAESSKTCILMTTQCKPPANIGQVIYNILPTDYVPEREVTVYKFPSPTQCGAEGMLSKPLPQKLSSDECQKLALATPEANYYVWGTTSGMCSLYSTCVMEASDEATIVAGLGDVDVPSPPKEGTITVYLLDANQQPIPNIPCSVLDESGKEVYNAKSDADGGVTITVPPGNYVIKPQFPNGTGPAPPDDVAGVVVKPGQNDPVAASFELDTRVDIQVRLVDGEGKPLANIPVAVYDKDGQLVERVTTDSNGVLNVKLEPGQYIFKPEYPADRQPANGNGDLEVTVPSGGGSVKPIEIKVPTVNPNPVVETETISFTLLDAGGEAMANIPVSIYDKDGNLVAETITDGNGMISVDLPPGEYVIRPDYPPDRQPTDGDGSITINVKPGSQTDYVIDTKVPAEPTNGSGEGSVALTLVDHGGAFLAGLPVGVYSEDGDYITTVTTSGTGTAIIKQPAGYYIIYPEYTAGCEPPEDQAAFMVEVVAGVDGEINYTTAVPAGCGGGGSGGDTTAYEDITILDKNGKPMSRLEVGIYQEDGTLLQTYVTDSNGKFTLEIPAGDYFIMPHYPDYMKVPEDEGYFYVELVPGKNPEYIYKAPVSVTTDIVKPDDNTDANTWPGQILGNIYRDDNENNLLDAGEGLGGVNVKLLDDKSRVFARTVTNANGGYTFTDLVPGTYTVLIEPSGDMQSAGTEPFTKVMNVQPNSTSRFDLRLLGAQNPTSGRLITNAFVDTNYNSRQDPGETPIVGAPVILTDSKGAEVARGVTDESGTATMEDVPFGMYNIKLDLSKHPEYATPYVAGRLEMKTTTLRIAFTIQP